MKIHLLIPVFFLFIIGCTGPEYVQLFDTASTNVKTVNNEYIYETDSLKITYGLWSNHGLLSFEIYNKLDKPIYIDWRNSAFIYNSRKYSYWTDETQIETKTSYDSYLFKGIISGRSGTSESHSTAVRKEKIAFIPPKSVYWHSEFCIYPFDNFMFSDYKWASYGKNDSRGNQGNIYYKDFLSDNSPVIFRNYLAISFSENPAKLVYLDHSFYVQSVKEMGKDYFNKAVSGTKTGNYKKETSFYLDIPAGISIEENIKQKEPGK